MSGFLDRLLGRRTAPAWWIAAVGATAVGVTLSATARQLPGTEVLSIEDGVDAVGVLALGGLGVILIRRGAATGLGRALLLMSELAGIVWLGSGLADAMAGGETPPAMVRLLALGAEVLHIAVPVLLLVAPLLLFPTGRLPSSRWRWAVVSAATGASLAMASMLLAPGYVDDDVHAWGTNPIGVKALDGLIGVVEAAGAVLVLASVLMAAAAVVVRLVRYRGARRRQMWWFLGGIAALVLGVVSDPGSSAVAQTAWALVIFATLLGGMAWALLGPPARAVHDEETETLRTSRPTGVPAPSATDT
jgi:hypothetical protein